MIIDPTMVGTGMKLLSTAAREAEFAPLVAIAIKKAVDPNPLITGDSHWLPADIASDISMRLVDFAGQAIAHPLYQTQ